MCFWPAARALRHAQGYDKAGLPGTAIGPLGHAETWCKGIDDLEKRCAEAYAAGARFAKWRNVLQIDPANGLPSDLAIEMCVQNLAQYAVICQRQGLVPIIEPEIVPNGTHGIEACANATEKVRARAKDQDARSAPPRPPAAHATPRPPNARPPRSRAAVRSRPVAARARRPLSLRPQVLSAQFAACKLHGVYLEGAVLKPNMVKNGLDGPKATTEQIAIATVTALKRTVPPAMPGIFFLSGETTLDEDNEETATINLNMMNRLVPNLPWSLSFSYGKALQKTCIVTWMGKKENDGVAQTALLARSKANSDATKGTYVPGSCKSIGAAGNVQMQGGAY